MKTIIIIALAIIISLVIIGGGLGTFFSNVGEGTEKIKQNEKLQDVKEQITSKITSEVTKFDDSVEKSVSKDTPSCDPSYPDFCIPPYSADLDCGQIPYIDFKVIQPDPHGFDRDNDGIGCES
jgi:hypothetical protein